MSSLELRAVVAAVGIFATVANAKAQTLTGQNVYQTTCSACHGAGVASAPKFGDKKAWSKLIAEPQAQLTAHGYVGVRGMPAKGGRADLSVEDFSKAVVYMANEVGSPWRDADAKMIAKINKEIARRERALKVKSK